MIGLLAILPLSLRIEAGGVGTRTLGVDFGLRRTGLALSSGFAPLPLRVVPCEGDSADGRADAAREVARAAAGEGAAQIVLGMPLNSTGGEGEQATVTREFARVLAAAAAPLPVFLWDERFSTFEARGRAATATHGVDAVAAAVILEEFFDADCRDCECVDAPEAAAAAAAAAAANDAAAASLPAVESASEKRRRLMAEARQQEEDLRGPDG